MKKILAFIFLLTSGIWLQAQVSKKPAGAFPPAAVPPLKSSADSISYALGSHIGSLLKQQGIQSVNTVIFSRAINDVLKNGKVQISDQQCQALIMGYIQKLSDEKSGPNKKAGEAFLAENKTKPGVVTLPSGLQYLILKEGDGPKPVLSDKVRCHYQGSLIDGTVFESSIQKGQPIDFPVSGVIRGWTEALQLMTVGSKWRLFIPSEMAYGDHPAGAIQPGSTLIFEVELLAIVK
jgi:FKBP-type peptidyl-prolyl cis-trans isomerase FklB